jgi:lipopolysaccharide export system permease protein
MRILTKYILIELINNFIFGIILFIIIFVSDKLFELIDLIIVKGVPFYQVLLLLIYILPSFIAIVIPMAWLLSNLMTFGNIAQNNEVIPIKNAGKSILTLGKVSLIISLLLSFLLVLFNETILPEGNWAFKKLYCEIISKRASVVLQPHTFINEFEGYILYVEEKNDRTGKLENILVYSLEEHLHIITAKEGYILSEPYTYRTLLRLNNGCLYTTNEDFSNLTQINFNSYDVELDIGHVLKSKIIKEIREKRISEIVNELKKENKSYLLIELHKRISIPFACLSFALIGFPLAIFIKRGGRGIGFTVSLILIFVYYLLFIFGETIAEKNYIPIFICMWLPNIVLTIIGICILYTLLKR